MEVEYKEDSQGRKTGRKKVIYHDVKTVYGTVSTPTGNAVIEMFGTDKDYDKVVVLDMPSIDIYENSVLWIDTPYSEDVAYDYIVRRVIKNHNFLTIGVRKVDVKYDKLTSDEFVGFCDSNDFTTTQALALSEVMCEMN